MPRRHRALIGEVEILRRIKPIARRAVIQNAFGMGDATLEGQSIDERLQRRARRTHGLRHVDGAGAILREIIGGADMREHRARRIVDDEDGC